MSTFFQTAQMKIFKRMLGKNLFNGLSDEALVRLYWRCCMHTKLDLKNPKGFNEKLQWLKLHDQNPVYTEMVDKAAAKDYVSKRIGAEHVIPTLGLWDRFDDIDFDALPERFVLKCTHDSGGIVICRDREKLDLVAARQKLERSLANNYYIYTREWPYKNVRPRILAEEYMENPGQNALMDYKFYCFDGKPCYLYVSQGMENHETAHMSFLTMDWQFAPFGRSDYKPFTELPPKPSRWEEMKQLSEQLSAGYKFLRVDLYEIQGKVYFSELTLCPCGGFMPFTDPAYDRKLGDMIKL